MQLQETATPFPTQPKHFARTTHTAQNHPNENRGNPHHLKKNCSGVHYSNDSHPNKNNGNKNNSNAIGGNNLPSNKNTANAHRRIFFAL
jgi:hypothetical protein